MTDEARVHDQERAEPRNPEPQFIIAHDGKYYLTQSVWEYDPRHPAITEEQQIGIGIWSHDGTVWFILENFMYNPDEPCFRKATWRFETVELGVFGEICAEFSQL